jgi:hypothetical protein
MFLQGLDGVTRATGREAAVLAEIRADYQAIELNASDQKYSHRSLRCRQCLSSAAVNSWLVISLTTGRHVTTMSSAGNVWRASRKLSRTRRLTRFRAAARLAHFLETARPSLACSHWLARPSTVKARSLARIARSKTLRNCLASVSRAQRWKRRPPTVPVNNSPADHSGTQRGSVPCAPALKHLAPAFGAHARTKAMRAFTPQVTRLKCLFHVSSPARAQRKGRQHNQHRRVCQFDAASAGNGCG